MIITPAIHIISGGGKENYEQPADKITALYCRLSREDEQKQLPKSYTNLFKKIVVSKPEYIDGQRCQSLDIYYNSAGIVREPMPEEIISVFGAASLRNAI